MKRIIITGPTGAIGHALIEKALSEGAEVYAVCHQNSKRISTLPCHPLLHVVLCNLDELDSLKNKISGPCDIFYHLAWVGTTGEARNNVELQEKNILFTLMAVKAAVSLQCCTFIGTGSQAEYGRTNDKLSAETPTFPETGYGIAKLSAGQLSRLLCQQKGIRHIWVRVLSVYGPYDGNNSMIMNTIKRLLYNELPDLTEGVQKWDYLYSKDAASALWIIGEKGHDKSIYVLGSGEAKPLKDYIMQLYKATGAKVPLGFGKIPYSEGQIMYLCANIDSLHTDTGFMPQYTFEDGIKETINWYKERITDENN